MGLSVTMVALCNAWWSITPTMRSTSIALLSCDSCWWSTRHTPASGFSTSNSSMGRGASTPHSLSANAVSEFTSLARAAVPWYNSAAPIAPAMESKSVIKWPQKRAPPSMSGM